MNSTFGRALKSLNLTNILNSTKNQSLDAKYSICKCNICTGQRLCSTLNTLYSFSHSGLIWNTYICIGYSTMMNFMMKMKRINCVICKICMYYVSTVGKIYTPIFLFFRKRFVNIPISDLRLISNESPGNFTFYRVIHEF